MRNSAALSDKILIKGVFVDIGGDCFCFGEIFFLLFILQGSGEDTEGLCDIIEAIAEVIKLTDPSLLYLEVSTLVSKYPDIR